jgi:hypothetical protein
MLARFREQAACARKGTLWKAYTFGFLIKESNRQVLLPMSKS